MATQGLNDLRNGVIRTPLPPRETFLDDPLRVIRCVRFASRFGFELLPELKNAAADSDIQVKSMIYLSAAKLKWRHFRKHLHTKSVASELAKSWTRCSKVGSLLLHRVISSD